MSIRLLNYNKQPLLEKKNAIKNAFNTTIETDGDDSQLWLTILEEDINIEREFTMTLKSCDTYGIFHVFSENDFVGIARITTIEIQNTIIEIFKSKTKVKVNAYYNYKFNKWNIVKILTIPEPDDNIGSIETHITEAGFKAGYKPDFPGITTDKKVAVIGSGPAGLSCATYLLRSGISVTMYESADRAGGLLTYGIPNFKLDKKIVERRISLLEEAGLKLILNTTVGKDIPFEELAGVHDAMFIGVGTISVEF